MPVLESTAARLSRSLQLGANARAALLLLFGLSLLLIGIALQVWLCQAIGTALLSILISWVIRVLLSPPMRRDTPQ